MSFRDSLCSWTTKSKYGLASLPHPSAPPYRFSCGRILDYLAFLPTASHAASWTTWPSSLPLLMSHPPYRFSWRNLAFLPTASHGASWTTSPPKNPPYRFSWRIWPSSLPLLMAHSGLPAPQKNPPYRFSWRILGSWPSGMTILFKPSGFGGLSCPLTSPMGRIELRHSASGYDF